MKRSLGNALLLAVALAWVSSQSLHAQEQERTRIGVGPTAGYAIDASEAFIGGMIRIAPPIMLGPTLPLMFDGSFEYYFDVEEANLFALSATALTEFLIPDSQVKPTAGAGLAITRFSSDIPDISDTNLNLQLQGGLMINIVSLDGMVRIGDNTDLILRASVLFGSLMR